MLVEKELILEAKQKLGEDAATLIANDLNLQNFDEKNLKSLCPFHQEDSPSFIWNVKDNYFHCFACGKIYGILDHFMDFYKLSYLDSVEKLFNKVNIKHRFGENGVKSNRNFRSSKYQSE